MSRKSGHRFSDPDMRQRKKEAERIQRDTLLAHVPEKWAPVFRPGHAPTQKRSGAYPTGYAPSACPAKVGTGFPTRTCANAKRSGAYPTGYAPSACPGKVGTGFPTRTCANAKKKRSVSNGIRS